jgi:hypothetical protein
MWRKLEVDGNPPSSVLCSSALSSFFGAFVSRRSTHFPTSDNLLPRFSTFIGVALGVLLKLLDADVVCVYGRRRGMMHGQKNPRRLSWTFRRNELRIG